MNSYNLYDDISKRTNGEIYVGVVGPVRTGKSTFIKNFMELFVTPNVQDEYILKKMQDELPQSSAGTTIMTTEPKFIPNDTVNVRLNENLNFKVKMIDCVGYLVNGATGYEENGKERLVNTPWDTNPMPFTEAAELGTEKVILDHSTIGIVITTDGSITGIDREAYEKAEEKAINKLKGISKPFVIILNSVEPEASETAELAERMQEKYGTSVIPMDVLSMSKVDVNKIFEIILYEFPISEIKLSMPKWIKGLEEDNWLKKGIIDCVLTNMKNLNKMQDVYEFVNEIEKDENIQRMDNYNINLGNGNVDVELKLKDELFYNVMSEEVGINIANEYELINMIKKFAKVNEEYNKVKNALCEVNSKGYGVVIPQIEELKVENPEIIKQGNKYGVRLVVKAPSVHLIETNIEAEISPIVGTEEQSRDLINYISDEVKNDPSKIWDINVFGKTLNDLVKDELEDKLNKLSETSKERFQLTLQRVINEGTGNLICIII